MIIAKNSRFTKLTLGLLLGLSLKTQAFDRQYVRDFVIAAGALLASYGVYSWFNQPKILSPEEQFMQLYNDYKQGKVGVDARNLVGQTLLMQALRFKKYIIAQELLNKGANLSLLDNDKTSALNWAIMRGNYHLVGLILEKNHTMLEVADISGFTPLMNAIIYCNDAQGLSIIKYLLREGADITKKCEDGRTAVDLSRERDDLFKRIENDAPKKYKFGL